MLVNRKKVLHLEVDYDRIYLIQGEWFGENGAEFVEFKMDVRNENLKHTAVILRDWYGDVVYAVFDREVGELTTEELRYLKNAYNGIGFYNITEREVLRVNDILIPMERIDSLGGVYIDSLGDFNYALDEFLDENDNIKDVIIVADEYDANFYEIKKYTELLGIELMVESKIEVYNKYQK